MKYSLEDISRVKENPKLVIKEILFLKYKFTEHINRKWYHLSDREDGVKVMEEDWDNLIILDGARPEFLLETETKFDASYDTRISLASESWTFMQENFQDKKYHDTVYVTSNPHAYKLNEDNFHKILNLLETEWDEETGTVIPERVVEKTTKVYEKYPNKRIIAHFMQPHYPFLQSYLKELGNLNSKNQDDENKDDPWSQLNIWGRFADVTHEEIISAYKKNHCIAAQAAKNLVSNLEGKTIITADHANLIGERGVPIPFKMYGHPPKFYKTELTRVPWIVCNYDERRKIKSEPPQSDVQISDENIANDRLEALGYK